MALSTFTSTEVDFDQMDPIYVDNYKVLVTRNLKWTW